MTAPPLAIGEGDAEDTAADFAVAFVVAAAGRMTVADNRCVDRKLVVGNEAVDWRTNGRLRVERLRPETWDCTADWRRNWAKRKVSTDRRMAFDNDEWMARRISTASRIDVAVAAAAAVDIEAACAVGRIVAWISSSFSRRLSWFEESWLPVTLGRCPSLKMAVAAAAAASRRISAAADAVIAVVAAAAGMNCGI